MKSITWIGGRVRSLVGEREAAGALLDIVLWFDATRDVILIAEIVFPKAPDSVIAEQLASALERNARHLPDRIRVSDQAAADAIRATLPPLIPIEVGPTPELDMLAQVFLHHAKRDGRGESYFGAGDITKAEIAALFREAAALYPLAPWRRFPDSDVLQMDVPALGVDGACLSILGALKQEYGILIFDSFDDYDEFGSLSAHVLGMGKAPVMLGGSFVSLNFERGADIPDSMRREITAHRWPVAGPRAYPVVMPMTRSGDARTPTARDIRVACAAAAGLAELARRHRRPAPGTLSGQEVVTLTVSMPEPVEVTMRVPHSVIRAEEESAEHPISDAARARAMRQAAEQIDRFLAAPRSAAMPPDWREVARFVCECLHDTKLGYIDGRWNVFSARQIEWFMLEHYPRKVDADPRIVQRAPEILDRYFEWMGAEGIEPAETVVRIRERVERVREAFLEAAADPSRFGPAKSLVAAMQAVGVDPTDSRAVAAFIQRYNQSLGAPKRPAERGRPRREKRAKAAKAGKAAKAAKAAKVYQLKVSLANIRPAIWRRLLLRDDATLLELHRALQVVMGWQGYHLHRFETPAGVFGKLDREVPEFQDERKARLRDVLPKPGSTITYEYDFGDGWEHRVRLENILPADPGLTHARLVAGARAAPPDDCGGISGYEHLLEVLADPAHLEHEELREWVGGSYDPEAFDLNSLNRALKRVGVTRRRSREPVVGR
ncbi:MAG TPA: plasmid pRiA4b ORF-3 family protein [Candidatus Sulfotelmatobacter sp.]|nr:plasmid pRiA4b ORF-3 family protein [Candidatus Sulfotelmatobacter sp.]